MSSFNFYLSILFILLLNSLGAQNTDTKFKCNILKIGTTYNSDRLIKAVENADWCGYIHKNENYTLNFDDGSIVQLLSYKLLFSHGIIISTECTQTTYVTDNAIYGILPSGVITKKVLIDPSIKTKNPKK